MLSGGIIGALLSLLADVLSKIGIDILKTPAKTTEVKNNDANISVKPDNAAATNRLNRL